MEALPGLRGRAEAVREQPGGLHRHADPFGDHGMRLARGVAQQEQAIAMALADPRPDGPHGQPRPVAPGAVEDGSHRGAPLEDVVEHRLARPAAGPAGIRSRESRRMQHDRPTRPSSQWTIPP